MERVSRVSATTQTGASCVAMPSHRPLTRRFVVCLICLLARRNHTGVHCHLHMVLPVREHHERLIVFEYKQDRFPRVDVYLAPSVVRGEKARGSPLLFIVFSTAA